MSEATPLRDPVSPFAGQVLALFATELSDVRFPDVDFPRLEAAAELAREAQLEVERIEATLEQARRTAAEQAEALTAQAQRALAYARVFAQLDSPLARRVAEIGEPLLTPSPRQLEPKRRGRPRKPDGEAGLFRGGLEASLDSVMPSEQAAE